MYGILVAQQSDEAAILVLVLQRSGILVSYVREVERALEQWDRQPADILVVAIPLAEPVATVRWLRTRIMVPLVLITNPIPEEMHCALLESGADLVVQRPYSARLLIAQIRSLMRRASTPPLPALPMLSLAGLTLDPLTRTVRVGNKPPQHLTPLEFRLLYTLMVHRNQVLPTEVIVERVWGYSGEGNRELVRSLVRRLRTKIEPDPKRPRYILTVPGVGYVLQEEVEAQPQLSHY